MLQQWKYAIVMILHENKDCTEYGNYRGISLVVHNGKILLRLSLAATASTTRPVQRLGGAGMYPIFPRFGRKRHENSPYWGHI